MNPTVLRWYGASQLQWAYYDASGYLVREVVEDEVPSHRLGPAVSAVGGYLMTDPLGGWYAAWLPAGPVG